jgi:ribosomal protein S7
MTEPKMPPQTCPMIDDVIKIIDAAYQIVEDTSGSDDIEELQTAIREASHQLRGESARMEPIRDANLALRNAAEYWREKFEAQEEVLRVIREALE